MKVNSIINEILYEGKSKSLQIFYNVDVFIQGFTKDETDKKVKEPEIAPESPVPETPAPIPAPPETPPVENTNEKGNLLLEEIYKSKDKGEIVVPKEDTENIQTIEDLLDYLSDIKGENGKQPINDLIIEIILSIAGEGGRVIEEIVKKGDKIHIDVKYGESIENSIGLKVNKNSGSDTITLSMTKDNKVIPGTFDTAQFNKQIIFYRNSMVD